MLFRSKSAAQRRDNLRTSTDAMREQLAEAVRERDDAAEQFARAAAQIENRDDMRSGRRRAGGMIGAALR